MVQRIGLLLLVALVTSACSHTRRVRWSAESPSGAHARATSAALVIPAEVRSRVETVRPGGFLGLFHYYRFPVGAELEQAFLAGARAAFTSLASVDRHPAPGEYDRILEVSMDEVRLEVVFDRRGPYEHANYVAAATVDLLDGETRAPLRACRLDVRGHSMQKSTRAIERALRQMADGLATCLLEVRDGDLPP